MKNKIAYLVLGGMLGAAAAYGVINHGPLAHPKAASNKPVTYMDIITPPKGEYGKKTYELIRQHEKIYNAFVKEVSALTLDKPMFKLDPYSTAPLSALAGLKTAEPTRVEVLVYADAGDPPLKLMMDKAATEHVIPILGLLPERENKVELITYTPEGQPLKTYVLHIETGSVKDAAYEPTSAKVKPAIQHNKLFFVSPSESFGIEKQAPRSAGYDEKGRIRWAMNPEYGYTPLMKPWKDGKWLSFMPNIMAGEKGRATKYLIAFDLVGRVYNAWYYPHRMHHDFKVLKNGKIVVATDSDVGMEDVTVTASLTDKPYLEDTHELRLNSVLHARKGILDIEAGLMPHQDWFHMNGIDENPEKGYQVYSGRNQSSVIAVNDDQSLRWILADHDGWPANMQPFLLKPKGKNFGWSWGQHSPVFRDANHLFIFDNGNFRSIHQDKALRADENYSRLVEYKIDDENKTVEQTWSFGKSWGNKLYAPYVGGVEYIHETGTVMGVFGGILTSQMNNPLDTLVGILKNRAHVFEVTHEANPKVLVDLTFEDKSIKSTRGFMIYRGTMCNVYCAYAK